jgi:hypothetical protein
MDRDAVIREIDCLLERKDPLEIKPNRFRPPTKSQLGLAEQLYALSVDGVIDTYLENDRMKRELLDEGNVRHFEGMVAELTLDKGKPESVFERVWPILAYALDIRDYEVASNLALSDESPGPISRSLNAAMSMLVGKFGPKQQLVLQKLTNFGIETFPERQKADFFGAFGKLYGCGSKPAALEKLKDLLQSDAAMVEFARLSMTYNQGDIGRTIKEVAFQTSFPALPKRKPVTAEEKESILSTFEERERGEMERLLGELYRASYLDNVTDKAWKVEPYFHKFIWLLDSTYRLSKDAAVAMCREYANDQDVFDRALAKLKQSSEDGLFLEFSSIYGRTPGWQRHDDMHGTMMRYFKGETSANYRCKTD